MARSSGTVDTLVPPDIMSGDLDQKIGYFRSNRIAHPKMAGTLNRLLRLTRPGCGTDMPLLIGPTGVGKSATFELAKQRILQEYAEETARDSSFIPVVLMEAPASGVRAFAWRSFYRELGKQLNEPLLDRKRARKMDTDKFLLETPRANASVGALKDTVTEALQHRRTKVILIDEGRHLITSAPTETLEAHMNGIKSLANAKNRTLALSGAYDLFKILELNDQVNRRGGIIHLSRYRMGHAEDEEQWRVVISSMQKRLPIRNLPDLRGCSSILMETCIGCVGSLSDTLARTVTAAHETDGSWRSRHLEESLLSESQVKKILEVVLDGEEMIASAVLGGGRARSIWDSDK